MYPTDKIYPIIFNFSESESVNELFEDLGYEGANFIELTGSLLINLLLIFSSRIVLFVTNFTIKKFLSKYQFVRRQAIKLK
jgi:hypothetical protein